MQLGQILDKKIKGKKKSNCHIWIAGSKNRVLEQK